jgi:hypothetical protein
MTTVAEAIREPVESDTVPEMDPPTTCVYPAGDAASNAIKVSFVRKFKAVS